MPASNARAVEKARTLAADVIILDLEDAVAPEAKPDARAAAVAAVRAGGFGRRESRTFDSGDFHGCRIHVSLDSMDRLDVGDDFE